MVKIIMIKDKIFFFLMLLVLCSPGVFADFSWWGGPGTPPAHGSSSVTGGFLPDMIWLYNDSTTMYFNDTLLNETIDLRATGLGGNSSWNQSLADDLYVNIAGDTMTGDLNLGTNDITNVNDITITNDAQIDDELTVDGGIFSTNIIEIWGNYYLKWLDNGGTNTYAYIMANTDEFRLSATDNNPMNFYYGNLGSSLGASMDGNTGNWNFTNNVTSDYIFTNLSQAWGYSWDNLTNKPNIIEEYDNITLLDGGWIGTGLFSEHITFNEGSNMTMAGNVHINNDLSVNGNLNVNGNTTSDYYFGDGSKLTGIQQGNLILFFLMKDAGEFCSLCSGNYTLSTIANITEVTLSANNLGDGSTLLGEWVTPPGIPDVTVIPPGNWQVHVVGTKTGGTKDIRFYYEIYKTNQTGGNEVLLSTSAYSNYLNGVRTNLDIFTYFTGTELNTTDRLRVKGYAYVSGGGSAPDIEAYIQGASNTRIEIPIGSVSVESFVPYTGALYNLNLGSQNMTSGSIITNNNEICNSTDCFNISNFLQTETEISENYSFHDLNITGIFKRNISNSREVCLSGCEYNTIQSAIDSIDDAAGDKFYEVRVHSGIYSECIKGKNFVYLTGYGSIMGLPIIRCDSETIYQAPTLISGIEKIALYGMSVTDDITYINITSGTHGFSGTRLYYSSSDGTVNYRLADVSAGALIITDSMVQTDDSGSSAGARDLIMFNISKKGTIDIASTQLEFESADVDDNFIVLKQEDESLYSARFTGNNFEVLMTNPSYSGSVKFYEAIENNTNERLKYNLVKLESYGNGEGYIYYINATEDNLTLASSHNSLSVEGFDGNYYALVGENNTLNAKYDDVTAINKTTGDGEFNYIYSTLEGVLVMSDRIGIGTDNPNNIVHIKNTDAPAYMQMTNDASGHSVIRGFYFGINPDGNGGLYSGFTSNIEVYPFLGINGKYVFQMDGWFNITNATHGIHSKKVFYDDFIITKTGKISMSELTSPDRNVNIDLRQTVQDNSDKAYGFYNVVGLDTTEEEFTGGNFDSIFGYPILLSNNFSAGTVVNGLNFAGSFLASGSGDKDNLEVNGITVAGMKSFYGSGKAKKATGILVSPSSNVFSSGSNVSELYGINILNSEDLLEGDNLTLLNIREPTRADNNKQVNLEGYGIGAGIWFDEEERVYSDGTNLIINTTDGDFIIYNNTGYGNIHYGNAIEHTYHTNKTDEEAYNLVEYALSHSGNDNNYTAWGECYKPSNLTDYSRPVLINVTEEVCEIKLKDGYTVADLESGLINENNYKDYTEDVCSMQEVEKVDYPYTVGVEGTNVGCKNVMLQKAHKYLTLAGSPLQLEDDSIALTGDTALYEHYVTNTTKDPATLTKVEDFYNTLQTKTYQEMKDLVLTEEGKLSDNVLFNYEKSIIGSYNLEAIGHTNRAMNVLMLWKIAKLEDKQQQQLDCWDLSTQAEIVSCMRNIE